MKPGRTFYKSTIYQSSYAARASVVVSVVVVLAGIDGQTLNLLGLSASNFLIAAFVLPPFLAGRLLREFPATFITPVALLFCMFFFHALSDRPGNLWQSFQFLTFLLFPYVLFRSGLSTTFIYSSFLFVITSQFWLLFTHGFSLPTGDLGGFFVSRRTVHSLCLGAFTLLAIRNIKTEAWRVALVVLVALLMLLSQARGATILFVACFLVFGGEHLSRRARTWTFVFSAGVICFSLWWQRGLIEHFIALFSTTGGSSTGYRLYLLEVLKYEFPNYWFSGLPAIEIQYLLADRFTNGILYQRFALDNAFTYAALRFGLAPLALLAALSVRMISTWKPFPVYLVGWFFLDDVLGNALGWLLLGQALVLVHTRKGSTGMVDMPPLSSNFASI